MLKYFSSLFFILFISLHSYSSHIVGGEFELLHISGTTYRLNLIVYFDVIHGNPEALDTSALVRVFRKYDNATMLDVTIPFVSQKQVAYFQPVCSNGEVKTNRLLYSTTINLPAQDFNHSEGYYIAWERCCRNYSISNIFSNPPGEGVHAGQTFFLAFPPVVDENGDPFINSSPQLFPPLNDFACPNRAYWVDFAGIDVDGDSLVYSLVTPLSTFNPVAIPFNGPGSGPYPNITWKSNFGLGNILGGSPDLAINDEGFLTVTPTKEGLFVFAIKCEEFRNGVKIGELMRDFQMLVVDKCPIADPPLIRGKALSAGSYTDANIIDITFPNTVDDANRCVNVQISDLDASKMDDSFEEKISLKIIARNFDPKEDELEGILPDITEATLTNGSVEQFDLCFPECPLIDPEQNDFFEIEVIAFDDACTLPLSDTLIVRVHITPPLNNAPVILSSNNDVATLTRTEVQGAGKSISIPIEGLDADGHNIMMKINTIGEFDLVKAGMQFINPPKDNFQKGSIKTLFVWNLDCNDADLDFSEGVTISPLGAEVVKQYKFEILLEDEDDCNFSKQDKLEMKLNIKFPNNSPPVLSFESSKVINNQLSINIGEEVSVNIIGNAIDEDSLFLELLGVEGTRDISNFDFTPAKGVKSVNSTLTWTPGCEDLNKFDSGNYHFTFLLKDNRCPMISETLSLDVFVSDVEVLKKEFIPPNIFTPNGDGNNDFFGMYQYHEISGQLINILPLDNCEGAFLNVRIFNRWGGEVFTSTDRDFKWFGQGELAGVYFYQIKYSHITYKGSVTLLY